MPDSYQYLKLPSHDEQGNPYPWKDEPNFAYYNDENTELDYFINRHFRMGYLCGYVVSKEKDLLDSLYNGEWKVHGGETTFCGMYKAGIFKESPIYCIGFDCAHEQDLIPFHYTKECHNIIPSDYKSSLESYYIYRDFKYVQEECKKLAVQVADYIKLK